MNDTAGPKEPAEIPESENLSVAPSARLPATVPPETLKGLLAVSELLQRHLKQDTRVFEEVIKPSAVHDSILQKTSLSASLEASRIIDAQIQSLELNKVFQSPGLELANAVNLSVGRLLEALLARLNPELIVLLRGARQSLDSENPDRVRHFAISLRELLTQVLHTLAPDDKIRAWSTVPEHYHGGRPTRRARLLYICRTVNHEPFSTFVDKDIDAALEFLSLFQRGTHEVAPKYTDCQLMIMRTRMENHLRFLLEIWKSGN